MTYISDNDRIISEKTKQQFFGLWLRRKVEFENLNDARSSSEIITKAKVVAAETNLLRYYKFDEAQGTVTDYRM